VERDPGGTAAGFGTGSAIDKPGDGAAAHAGKARYLAGNANKIV
jgi:hypothetical protein